VPGIIASDPQTHRRTAWLLVAARAVRSLWQGALVVDFTLYLRALGWTAVAISTVLAASLLAGAALTMLLGPLSDRLGRRRFLLVYDALQGLAALVAFATPATVPLTVAAIVGGFGRGGNGAAGPFAPLEQAWLAQCVPLPRRGRFYSLNAATGFGGMALGAVIAGVPGWLGGTTPPAAFYRPLFLLTALLSAVTFGLILAGRDVAAATPSATLDRAARRRENHLILRLVLANFLNGAGLGLTGPLISYWFAITFHRGPASIGPMIAAGFALAMAASLINGWIAERIGMVRAVVSMRLAALVLLVALPFAPSFPLAAVLYTARTVLNRGTTGARSALSVSIVGDGRRGFSSASSNVALQIPRAIGPILAGMLFESGLFAAPFLIAALFQGGYLWLYDRSFRDVALK
jgi:MFS family permease